MDVVVRLRHLGQRPATRLIAVPDAVGEAIVKDALPGHPHAYHRSANTSTTKGPGPLTILTDSTAPAVRSVSRQIQPMLICGPLPKDVTTADSEASMDASISAGGFVIARYTLHCPDENAMDSALRSEMVKPPFMDSASISPPAIFSRDAASTSMKSCLVHSPRRAQGRDVSSPVVCDRVAITTRLPPTTNTSDKAMQP